MSIQRLTENLGLKALSLMLAVLLWLSVTGATEGEMAIRVPVHLRNLAPQLFVMSKVPHAVELRVAGPKIQLMRLVGDHVSVSLDLQGVGAGNVTFADLERTVVLPVGLRVTRVYPATIDMNLVRADK